MTLNKRYLRNFKHNLSFYISTSLLTALVVYIFIAISASYQSQADHVHEQIKKTAREDGQFSLYGQMTDDDIAAFEQENNVIIEKMEHYDCEVTHGADSDKDTLTLRVFSPSEKLNKYEVSAGNDITADDEILVSELFARACKVDIGDKLTVRGHSGEKTFTVKGYAVRYDYFFCLKTPTIPSACPANSVLLS